MVTESSTLAQDGAASPKPQSRLAYQLAWQAERRKSGLCWMCGDPVHVDKDSGRKFKLCKKHLRKDRKRKREELGCRPRRKNGRGRPVAV